MHPWPGAQLVLTKQSHVSGEAGVVGVLKWGNHELSTRQTGGSDNLWVRWREFDLVGAC